MKEREIEKYLVDRVRKMGGAALKFVSPGCTGVPDRLVILPGGKVGFLELKAPGEKLRKEQYHRLQQLRALHCQAGTADSREGVDRFLLALSAGIPVPAMACGMMREEAPQ